MKRRKVTSSEVTGPMPDTTIKTGWCMTGHHEGCPSPQTFALTGSTNTCPCDCHSK